MAVDSIVCLLCGYDPRATDHFHSCVTSPQDCLPGTPVHGPARGGGEVHGRVLEARSDATFGTQVLVQWDGRHGGTWYPLGHVRVETGVPA